MTTPALPFTTLGDAGAPSRAEQAATSPADIAPFARAIIAHALVLGLGADLLLRDGPLGLGYPIWLTLLACSLLALAQRAGRKMTRESGAWLGTAVVFGAGMAWREAEHLRVFDFLTTLFALRMAALALGSPRSALRAQRLRDTLWAAVGAIRSIAAGLAPLLFGEASLRAPAARSMTRARPVVRAVVIALPPLVIFGSLLRGADPV
ncbi:MAG: hypothetical protein LH467_09880, partial [Gemmatimonadaceae bacterium]|nr:hypothetical protein [Gemmatimonadaceae bacterium]